MSPVLGCFFMSSKKGYFMNRSILMAIVSSLFIAAGCQCMEAPKTTDAPAPKAPATAATAATAATPAAPAAPVVAPTSAPAPVVVAPKPAEVKWHEGITGTYKGVVGGNGDALVLTFTRVAGELTATYTIDDPAFNPKPYNGKLMKFAETKGKELTLTCRYEDDMNAGGYELTFSKDLKQITGTYAIDGEGESDGNNMTATKQ